MVQAPSNVFTFAEYLTYNDGTDARHELVRGNLLVMTPPAWSHVKIARFLEDLFRSEIRRLDFPWDAVRGDVGQRTGVADSRLPDVLIAPAADLEQLRDRPAVLETPASLVVEVVSKSSVRDDYLHKLAEYEAIGVQEYWLVDYLALGPSRYLGIPKEPTVFVYTLNDVDATATEREYAQPRKFQGRDRIQSPLFPELHVTASAIFEGE